MLTEQDVALLRSKGLNPEEYDAFDPAQELEDVTPAQQPEEPGMLKKAWELANTPVTKYMPDSVRNVVRDGLPGISYNTPLLNLAGKSLGISPKIGEGLNRVKGDIREGMLSPLGLGTLAASGPLSQFPKVSAAIGATFGGQSLYNMAQRPKQFQDAKGDLAGQTEAIAGGVADAAFGLLGAHAAYKGIKDLAASRPKPESVVKTQVNEGPTISTDDFYGTSEVNDPLPTPWLQTAENGKFTVSDKVVNNKILEVAPQLEKAPQPVKREFLQQRNLGETGGSDTPDLARFKNPGSFDFETRQQLDAIAEKAKNLGLPDEQPPIQSPKRPSGEFQTPPILPEKEIPYTRPASKIPIEIKDPPSRELKSAEEIVTGKKLPEKMLYPQEETQVSKPVEGSGELKTSAEKATSGDTLYSGLSAIPEIARHIAHTVKDITEAAKRIAAELKISLPEARALLEKIHTLEGKTYHEDRGTVYANPIGKVLDVAGRTIGKAGVELAKHDPTRPQIDKVEDLGPTGKYVAPRMRQYYDKYQEYQGKLVNSIEGVLLKAMDFGRRIITQDSPTLKRVLEYLQDKDEGVPTRITLTPQEQGIVDAIRANLKESGDMQNAKGIPVWSSKGPRAKILRNEYFPHMMSVKTQEILTSKQGSPEFADVKNRMVNYWTRRHGLTPAKALEHFEDIVNSFKNAGESNKGAQFGPVDKAEGLGLPRELREQNLMHVMSRFNNRVARRFAYFDAFESDPHARYALGISHDVQGNPTPRGLKLPTGEDVDVLAANPSVEPILRDVQGKRSILDLKIDAANSALKSVAMQAWSGARDFLATNVLGWQHQLPSQYLQATLKGWADISNSLAEGLAKGVIRHDTISFEGIEGGVGDVVTNLQRLRGTVGKLGLRNIFEQGTRAVTFAQGKFLAADNVYKLSRNPSGVGSKQRLQFMEDFASDIPWKGRASLTPEEVQTIAARYTESVQGSYNYKGLPRATQEGVGSYILNWNRWNIEKKNNFVKHVVKPMSEGNYWPLLGATLGTAIGGEAVMQAQQIISGGRKDKAPTVKEALSSEDRAGEALFYKLATLADAAGVGGITSGIAHNLMKWRFGAKAQDMLDYPLVGNFKDNLTLVGQAIEAFESGEQDVGINYIAKFLELNIQNARLLINQFSENKEKDIEHSNKVRDYTTFKELSGEHKAYDATTPNPLEGRATKDFKRASIEDVRKLPELAGKAVNQALIKAKSDPVKMITNIRGLKSNPITWAPSVDNNTPEFGKYLNYLTETQGPEAASQFLRNYITQREVNKAKSSLIPTLPRP